MKRLTTIGLICCTAAMAQWVDPPTSGYSALNAFLQALVAAKTVTVLPTSCTVGKDFFLLTTSPGQLYYCDATNHLTALVPATRQVNGHPLSADVTVTAPDVGLGSVDNTSDAAKPVSTATQTALNAKLAAASNLSDLASAAAARANLGLGSIATRNVGTTAGTAAAGDDSRFSDSRAPTGAAGGGLSGTYPNPALGALPVCVGAPGNTTGAYGSLCEVRATGALWACANAGGCTVAGDWALPSAVFTLPNASFGAGAASLSRTATAGVGGVTAKLLAAKDTTDPTRRVLPASGGCGGGFAATTATVANTFELYVVPGTVITGVADNAVTAGHILVGGTTTPGRVKDSGLISRAQIASGTCIVGVALQGATTGSDVLLEYDGTGSYGAGPVANGSTALGTTSIPANSCAAVLTVSAPGVLSTDVVTGSFNADVTGVTGYGVASTDGLFVTPFATVDNVNFRQCNPTGSAIVPGAATVNWRAAR